MLYVYSMRCIFYCKKLQQTVRCIGGKPNRLSFTSLKFESLKTSSGKAMASESNKPFLPFEIIINILKRLPIKSIVRFQCVCKDWKNLFTIPSFIAEQVLHSAHENPFLLIHDYDHKYRCSSLRLLNQKMETAEVLSTHSIDSLRRRWRINGSCNGLLCVELDTEQGRFPISYLLWNPVMNEVREVPQTLNDFSSLSMVGFGYSSVVNDFKIVRLYHPELLKKKEDQISFDTLLNRAQVFSLSTGSWKGLEFGAFNTELSDDGVSANGNIFWVGVGFFPIIVSFHIATEVFTFTTMQILPSSVDVPEHFLCPYMPVVHGNKLAMYEGIHSSTYSDTYSIYMWVVEEGDSESGKSLVCTEKYKIGPLATVLTPLCIWRNQIVCVCAEGEVEGMGKGALKDSLYLFNLTTKEWTKFHHFSAAYYRCSFFNYERSLVSVCNI